MFDSQEEGRRDRPLDDPWRRFAVIASTVVIALLIVSNVLLLTLVLRDDGGTRTGAGVAVPTGKTAVLPTLPQPTPKSSSSKALIKELDKTQKQFAEPIDAALTQLGSVGQSTASLDQLPALLQQMVYSTSELDAVAPGIAKLDRRMRSLNREITRMTSFSVGLGPVIVDLVKTMREMRTDLGRIRTCTETPSACR